MTDKAFQVKNGLIVNSSLLVVDPAVNTVSVANTLTVGQAPSGVLNSTAWSGTANNAFNVGTVTAANVVSNSQLQANLANYASLGGLAANVQGIMATNNQTLTFSNPQNWDTSHGAMATITLTANTTMNAPTSLANGSYVLIVKQDATGSRHITWNSVFKWPAGAAPSLSTAANAKDIFSFIYDGTFLYGSYVVGVA